MSSSREDSPDWLRCFQAPTHSAVMLSSDSESPPSDRSLKEEKVDSKELSQDNEVDHKDPDISLQSKDSSNAEPSEMKLYSSTRKKNTKNQKSTKVSADHRALAEEETSEKHVKAQEQHISVWALSSDSESCHDSSPIKRLVQHKESTVHKTSKSSKKEKDKDAGLALAKSGEDSPLDGVLKEKSSKKRVQVEDHTPRKKEKMSSIKKPEESCTDAELPRDEASEKNIEPTVSSRLQLVLSEKVQRSKALVECEGGSIDMSGDVGAVGRVIISDGPTENQEMFLDLKGTIYKTTIVPSRTFCIVSFGQSEAKIEAIMNDFIRLKPQSNVYEAETMVEGTLDGFSFDSEDEADKIPKAVNHQADQSEGAEEQPNGKGKGKTGKTSGVGAKKGKPGEGKAPVKKVKRKTQAAKKTKAKK